MPTIVVVLLAIVAVGGVLFVWRHEYRAVLDGWVEPRAMDARRREHERAAAAEWGGSPKDPILVASPSEVEAEAETRQCTMCNGPLRIEQHDADTIDGERLRVARMKCRRCGSQRGLYFRIGLTS